MRTAKPDQQSPFDFKSSSVSSFLYQTTIITTVSALPSTQAWATIFRSSQANQRHTQTKPTMASPERWKMCLISSWEYSWRYYFVFSAVFGRCHRIYSHIWLGIFVSQVGICTHLRNYSRNIVITSQTFFGFLFLCSLTVFWQKILTWGGLFDRI